MPRRDAFRDHLSVLDVVGGLVPRADQSPVLDRSARQVCAHMSTPPRDREVSAVDVSDGKRSRTGHRTRGSSATGHTVICFAMPASRQPPTVLAASLSTCPRPHAGKHPWWQVHLPAPMIASCGRMTRFLISCPTQNRGHTPTVSLLTDSGDSGHTVRDKTCPHQPDQLPNRPDARRTDPRPKEPAPSDVSDTHTRPYTRDAVATAQSEAHTSAARNIEAVRHPTILRQKPAFAPL